jgi:dTDP-4-dehydrorhamnose 3,5-epimerase
MQVVASALPGVSIIQPRVFNDSRGEFTKTYHVDQFRELGIEFAPREVFYSVSRRNVLRGLHVHVPPRPQVRLTHCIQGAVLDVVVDLWRGASFGKVLARELSADNHELLFIPEGFAHGFLALTEPAVMVYHASPVHSPAHDKGILWSSIDFEWPVSQPVVSERDGQFPRLVDFATPF